MPPMLARALPCRKSTQHRDRCEEKGNARMEEIFTWEEKIIPCGRRSKQSTKNILPLMQRGSMDLWEMETNRNMQRGCHLVTNGKCLKLRQIPFCFNLSQSRGKSRRDEIMRLWRTTYVNIFSTCFAILYSISASFCLVRPDLAILFDSKTFGRT